MPIVKHPSSRRNDKHKRTWKMMLGYLVIVLLALTSQSLGQNCIHDFCDAEEVILH